MVEGRSGGDSADDFSVLEGAIILVVDDEPATLSSIVRVLEQCKAQVITCSTADQAERVIYESTEPLDAAVVDYYLLDRLGLEVIESLRRGRHPCCALMMTGSSSPDAGADAIRAGADGFLIKPFSLDDFLNAVRDVVVKTRAWRSTIQGTPNRPDRATAPPFLDSDAANTAAVTSFVKDQGIPGARHLMLEDVLAWLTQHHDLSRREAEILQHVIMGEKNLDIAEGLQISPRTVKFHIRNLLKKVGARNRADIIRIYITGIGPAAPPALVAVPDDDDDDGGDDT